MHTYPSFPPLREVIPFKNGRASYIRLQESPYFVHRFKDKEDCWHLTLRTLNKLNPTEEKGIEDYLLYKIWNGNIGKLDQYLTRNQIKIILIAKRCPSFTADLIAEQLHKDLQRGIYKVGIDPNKFKKRKDTCVTCGGTGEIEYWTNAP